MKKKESKFIDRSAREDDKRSPIFKLRAKFKRRSIVTRSI